MRRVVSVGIALGLTLVGGLAASFIQAADSTDIAGAMLHSMGNIMTALLWGCPIGATVGAVAGRTFVLRRKELSWPGVAVAFGCALVGVGLAVSLMGTAGLVGLFTAPVVVCIASLVGYELTCTFRKGPNR